MPVVTRGPSGHSSLRTIRPHFATATHLSCSAIAAPSASVDSLEHFLGTGNSWVVITGAGSLLEGGGVVQTVEQEKSPVHTASHTAAMLRLAQIAAALGSPRWTPQLADVPDPVAAAVALRGEVAEAVGSFDLKAVLHFAGGSPARSTSYEGALKVRAAAHTVAAEAHDVEGVLHGPLVSIQPGESAVLIAQPGASLDRSREVAAALEEIGGNVLAVRPEAGAVTSRHRVTTPLLDEAHSPIVNVVPCSGSRTRQRGGWE